MDRSSRVRVTGPLEPYAVGFRAELAGLGYSQWTATALLHLMQHLSLWLASRRLDLSSLTASEVQGFLHDRRASGQVRRVTARGLAPLLSYLRRQGVVTDEVTVAPDGPLEELLADFVGYLGSERGLRDATSSWYCAVARQFLSSRLQRTDEAGPELASLNAGEIRSFVLDERERRSVGSVKNVVTALRSLLRFAYLRGYTATLLADAVPAAAGWRGGSMPLVLQPGQVSRLMDSCDRRTGAGRRDYAILVVLARLGLRANEVALLTVDDVDWRAGEILVSGKGSRHERLPLPVDVGKAIADYCRRGRPSGGCRRVFLHARAPYSSLSSSAVSHVVTRACDRAGLARVGAHRLRHTAAAAMRRAGAPMTEISQVLRHRHPATTARYGRVDPAALAIVAQPWPAGTR
jgi:integrase/recombinase XerD